MAIIFKIEPPVKLAEAPKNFSFSLLTTLRQCPRRWQLTYSTYPNTSSPYPAPYNQKAVLGQVVHEVLQKLVGWLVENHSPQIGSPEFAGAMQTFDFPRQIQKVMKSQLERLKQNPRAWRVKDLGFRELDVRNQVFQLLRFTWRGRTEAANAPSNDYRNLAEVRVVHPTIPLAGYLDLVEIRPDGDIITDYKSGSLNESYRDQVMLYGLLWWRERERLPRLLRVVSVSGERIEIEPTENDLSQYEAALAQEIERWKSLLQARAPAKVDPEHCQYCHVRVLCEEFWVSSQKRDLPCDVEARIEKQRSSASVTACVNGAIVDITADPSSEINLADLPVGSKVRLLSAMPRQDGSLGLTRHSELYRLE